jgi:Glycosyl hydrolase family 63 C-terminal domain
MMARMDKSITPAKASIKQAIEKPTPTGAEVNAESQRLQECHESQVPWKKWGPYLSERQWGTVREDYSDDGNAWDYFSHDQARSRAYRWGEDGLAGISDNHGVLCFALALWNGNDPILKERLFGLTNSEGNHGEDVKEYYFYLDSTPTHSYMKYLYKYPHRAYPYSDLVETNRRRFYYDLLRLPDGSSTRLKVRSMVGLLPLCATTVVEPWQREHTRSARFYIDRLKQMPELLDSIHPTGPGHFGVGERGIIALLNPQRLRRILTRMLDENEFLSPYGIRSLSKYHRENPYVFNVGGQEHRVDYLPTESNTGLFGGNSNWRGPVWVPVNALIIRSLMSFYAYYGDNFKIECPTGSGRLMNLFEVAREIVDRLRKIFLRDEQGRRPVYGGTEKFQSDPHWRDNILFYEYFHGDNGAGLGASHQTGWTGLIGGLINLFGRLDPTTLLGEGTAAAFDRAVR